MAASRGHRQTDRICRRAEKQGFATLHEGEQEEQLSPSHMDHDHSEMDGVLEVPNKESRNKCVASSSPERSSWSHQRYAETVVGEIFIHFADLLDIPLVLTICRSLCISALIVASTVADCLGSDFGPSEVGIRMQSPSCFVYMHDSGAVVFRQEFSASVHGCHLHLTSQTKQFEACSTRVWHRTPAYPSP
jgi:hypothetical protein